MNDQVFQQMENEVGIVMEQVSLSMLMHTDCSLSMSSRRRARLRKSVGICGGALFR